MSPIRPLARDDLEAVVDLYQRVVRPRTQRPMPELCDYFERLIIDHPWSDPELPGLVFEEKGSGIVGFIASYARRLVYGDEELRLACSGQLVAHPDFRSRGVGALLMRRYLKGPQDVTITDGATDEVTRMWETLGGQAHYLASNIWARPLAPTAYARRIWARRMARQGRPPDAMTGALDRLVARVPTFKSGPTLDPTPTRSIPVGPEALVEASRELAASFRLRPAYDEEFARWLVAELESTVERGDLMLRAVNDESDRPIGLYVAFHEPDGVVQVQSILAAASDSEAVIARLLRDAAERGASAVEGRLEPHVYAPVRAKGFFLRRSEWALVHSPRPELVAAILSGDGFLSRLEGEWWTVPHKLLPGRPSGGAGGGGR